MKRTIHLLSIIFLIIPIGCKTNFFSERQEHSFEAVDIKMTAADYYFCSLAGSNDIKESQLKITDSCFNINFRNDTIFILYNMLSYVYTRDNIMICGMESQDSQKTGIWNYYQDGKLMFSEKYLHGKLEMQWSRVGSRMVLTKLVRISDPRF